jgi:ornithine carbamoyltransferase
MIELQKNYSKIKYNTKNHYLRRQFYMRHLIRLTDYKENEIKEIFEIEIIEQIARYSNVPIINAMTDINHPCEIFSDLSRFFLKIKTLTAKR